MSLIFEALQTLESDRAGVDSTASLDAEEFLWCAEHKVASKWETTSWGPNDEGRQPPAADEPRLHAVEFPLPVAAETRRALPTPAAIDQNTPPPSPGAALAGSFKESPLAAMPSAVQRGRVRAPCRAAVRAADSPPAGRTHRHQRLQPPHPATRQAVYFPAPAANRSRSHRIPPDRAQGAVPRGARQDRRTNGFLQACRRSTGNGQRGD